MLKSIPDEQLKSNSKNKRKVKILLVDDHQIVRKGIRKFIGDEDDMEIVGEAADGREAITLSKKTKPDIVLMDINMPEMNGIEATRKITSDMPDVCVIGLSMHHDKRITEEMRSAGASAYLSKTEIIESLVETIREGLKSD